MLSPGPEPRDLDLEEALVPGAVLLPAAAYHCYVYDSLQLQDLDHPRIRLCGTGPAFVAAVVPVDQEKRGLFVLEGWAYVLLLDDGGPFWIGASAFVIKPPWRVLDRTNGPRGQAPSTGPLVRPLGAAP